jgi:hypothetical protein
MDYDLYIQRLKKRIERQHIKLSSLEKRIGNLMSRRAEEEKLGVMLVEAANAFKNNTFDNE